MPEKAIGGDRAARLLQIWLLGAHLSLVLEPDRKRGETRGFAQASPLSQWRSKRSCMELQIRRDRLTAYCQFLTISTSVSALHEALET
jgi:hypothetical protein